MNALVEKLNLRWGEPQPVPGKPGIVRRFASPTHKFWQQRARDREAFVAAGIRVYKQGEAWIVEWSNYEDARAAELVAQRKIERERQEAEDRAAALSVPNVEIDERGLRPHQPSAVKRLVASLRANNAALDASGTGVGKTYAGLSSALQMGGPVGVICPKPVVPAWMRAFAHFGARPLFVINYEAIRQRDTRWTCPREDRLGFDWFVPPDSTLIFDEAHMTKAYPPSRNAWLLASAHRQKLRVLLLTASLAAAPQEMWATGRVLGLYQPGKGNFKAWVESHGCKRKGKSWVFPKDSPGMSIINRHLFPKWGNRLTAGDIEGFPENLKLVEAWDFGGKEEIDRIYAEMEVELRKLRERAAKDRTPDDVRVIQLRFRQKTELLKIPTFASQILSSIEEGYSVAMFVNFDASVTALQERLKTDSVIRGGQSSDGRQRIIDAFNRGTEKVIICNIRAGGVGISLHDETGQHPRLALICPTYSAVDLLQACGRCPRSGGGNVITKIVFAAGTVEESAMDAVTAKLEHLDRLNDGELTFSQSLIPADATGAFQPALAL